MARCPYCDQKLSQRDLDQGLCVHCHRSFFLDAEPADRLPSGRSHVTFDSAAAAPPAGPSASAAQTLDSAANEVGFPAEAPATGGVARQTDQTLDSAALPQSPGFPPGAVSADAQAAAQTLDSAPSFPSPPASPPTDSSGDQRLGETVDSAAMGWPGLAEAGDALSESQAAAQTLDSAAGLPSPPWLDDGQGPRDRRLDETVDSAALRPVPPGSAAEVPPESEAMGRTLDSATGFALASSEKPPTAGTRLDQTLDSATFAGSPAPGGDFPAGQTVESATLPLAPAVPPSAESDEARAAAQTLDSAVGFGPPSRPAAAAPDQREDQTLDSASFARPSGEIPPDEAARTLDSAAGFVPPLGQRPGTVPDRVEQTLDSASFVLSKPPSQGDSSETDAVRATPGRKLATAGGLAGRVTVAPPGTQQDRAGPADLDERVSRVWAGKFQPDATPHTSLKVSSQTVEQQSNLVIQTRIFRRTKRDKNIRPDYDLLGQLGEGGMGVVLAARQASIDRLVAVKMLKPAATRDLQARQKFLSEAVVTGDLEHPNIVPIYDLGSDDTGALFYSMKRVKGTPWNKVIGQKTFQENIEILMKVADAVAFAHSRGVIHRDLKPENIMLGDFGEVLVMDWGLALTLGGAPGTASMGGTPAYMAPEMAFGPADACTTASDIYLLGAILFEIVTGFPPHTGKNVLECLFAASKNKIRPTEKKGEVMDIAMKAMATDPKDRYATVADFQNAIRQHLSHTQSIALSTRAQADLVQAQQTDDYEVYARARFGFQEAIALWEGNTEAVEGLARASAAYARSALAKGDFDLGASLLDPNNAEHRAILAEIDAGRREREARQQRLRAAKRVGAALAATVFVVVTVAFFWIRAEAHRARVAEGIALEQRNIAERQTIIAQQQRAIAEEQREEAKKQTLIAQSERAEAVKQKNIADEQRVKAELAQRAAEDAQLKEEYGAYVARIGLAAEKIEENAFDRAIALLDECPEHLRDWEWGRLKHLCSQEIRNFSAGQPLDAAALSADGKRLATGGWNGRVEIWDAETGQQLVSFPSGAQNVFSLAFSPDGRHVAAGTNDPPNYLKIFDARTGALVQALPGHRDAVLSVVYARDGKAILTSSYDATARLYDLTSGQSAAFEGHEWWVWSANFSPDEKRIVTACQDGSAMVWDVASRKAGAPFLGHEGPVYHAVFSPDGKLVASAGYDKRILLWDPAKVRPFDFDALSEPGKERRRGGPECEVLEGHLAGVRYVRFSPNGKLLVSGGNDNTVRVWDVATRQLLKTLRGHGGRVRCCEFAPDGNSVLSAGHDRLAKMWSIKGYEEVRVFQGLVLAGHRDAILGADFSPDGRRLVSASRDRSAKLWDVSTGRELRHFKEGHEFLATRAVFLPDGKRLITAAVDNTARIWDVATGSQLAVLEGTGPAAVLALSRDGRFLLTGSDEKSARLWDLTSGSVLLKLQPGRSDVTAAAISPDGRLLFTGDAVGRCRLWDAATGELRWTAEAHSRAVTGAVFLPAGDAVLTSSIDNTVAQWDVRTGRERLPWILKHPGSVFSMALSPDGRRVATACSDKAVRLWDIASAKEVAMFTAGGETVNAVAFSPDGRRLVTTDAAGNVRLWDAESFREIRARSRPSAPFLSRDDMTVQAWSAVFSPDGTQVLTIGGNEACLWDVADARPNVRFSPHNSVASARFSPDGTRVVTGSWDKTARIWNVEKAVSELRLEGGHRQYVNDAAFSPDGARVVTAGDDRAACVWDARTGKLLLTLRGHGDRVSSAVFSPDGKRILTASNDKTARVWDAQTGETIRELVGHREAVLAAAYSRDGKRILTGGEDHQAKVWNAETGKEEVSLQGHTAAVTSVAFSPNGRRALTGSFDHTAKLWDAETGKELLTLKGHKQELTIVGFSPDGQSALTGSRDGTLLLWLATAWRKQAPPPGAATASHPGRERSLIPRAR